MTNKDDRTTAAEKSIAKILSDLEEKTDQIIATVSLVDIDVTEMNDNRKRLNRKVSIETYRIPGNDWAT